MTDFKMNFRVNADNSLTWHPTRKDLAILKSVGLSRDDIFDYLGKGNPVWSIEIHVKALVAGERIKRDKAI
jgi:hypothetical protein